MPSVGQHLATTASNEAVAERLLGLGEYGWATTSLFYAALHLVEAYLSRSGVVSASHREREANIRSVSALRPVVRFYTRLKKESENARYECVTFSGGTFTMLRDNMYVPLSLHLRRLMR